MRSIRRKTGGRFFRASLDPSLRTNSNIPVAISLLGHSCPHGRVKTAAQDATATQNRNHADHFLVCATKIGTNSAPGGDIWPMTWAQDNTLRTAWGDGEVGCSAKVTYGVAAITSATPSTALQTISCGPRGMNQGKIMTLLAAGSNLYAVMAMEGAGAGYPVWLSTDGGRLWQKPSWAFPSLVEAFVQFGRANAGAPGGYAYLLDARETEIHLMRVPVGSAQTQSAYEYFSGSTTAAAWSRDAARSKPVFADRAGTRRPNITFNPGLRRYLMTVAHSVVGIPSSHKQGLFEAPNLWGPWRTVFYETANFLNMRGGCTWGCTFRSSGSRRTAGRSGPCSPVTTTSMRVPVASTTTASISCARGLQSLLVKCSEAAREVCLRGPDVDQDGMCRHIECLTARLRSHVRVWKRAIFPRSLPA